MCTQTQVSDFEDIGNTCKYISIILYIYIHFAYVEKKSITFTEINK